MPPIRPPFLLHHLIFLPLFIALSAIPIFAYDLSSDNQIIGTPKVVCGESEVAVDIITAKPFRGNIFVKGRAKDASCRQSFSNPALNTSAYALTLGKCGMQRLRSANPRGINFAVVIVVSFHPAGFITKNDRAFHVSCFYTEPDEIVTSSFEVSQLPTQELSDQMQNPTCKYSVHSGSVDGPELSWANVGDVIFHVWECKGPNKMGMLVKKCFVTDGDGEDHGVVDENGCSLDHSLIGEVTYAKDGMKAHAKSQVFRYADSNQLFFTCQIRMCHHEMCKGLTPPKCDGDKKKKKKHRKKKKHDHKKMTNLDDVMDVDGEWSVEEATAEAGGLLALLDANVTTTEADGKNDNSTVLPANNNNNTTSSSASNLRKLELAEQEEEEGDDEEGVEEEDGEGGKGWTLKGPTELFSRKSRSLTTGTIGTNEVAVEVDVASPQMLILDSEDRVRIGPLQVHSLTSTSSPDIRDQSRVPEPLGPSVSSPPICLSPVLFLLLIIPGVSGLLVGVGSALTLCAHWMAARRNGKIRRYWHQ